MPTNAPHSTLGRLARYAAPTLLFFVALSQVLLATTGGALLTPAKGGGFGLFSTVDKLANRELVVTVVEASGKEWRWPEGGHARARVLERVRSLPSQAHLQAAARYVSEQIATRPGMVLRVEVRKLVFAPGTREVRRSLVAHTRYDMDVDAAAR